LYLIYLRIHFQNGELPDEKRLCKRGIFHTRARAWIALPESCRTQVFSDLLDECSDPNRDTSIYLDLAENDAHKHMDKMRAIGIIRIYSAWEKAKILYGRIFTKVLYLE
jgi:hypothetical protein